MAFDHGDSRICREAVEVAAANLFLWAEPDEIWSRYGANFVTLVKIAGRKYLELVEKENGIIVLPKELNDRGILPNEDLINPRMISLPLRKFQSTGLRPSSSL